MAVNLKGFLLGGVAILISGLAHTATDPISWKLDKPFQNPLYAGRKDTVTYTFTNQLPRQLVKPIIIIKNSNAPNEFQYLDRCSGKRLLPKESCIVSISLLSQNPGSKQAQLIISGYDNNQVKLPPVVAQISNSFVQLVSGTITTPLPYQITSGSAFPYSVTFTNSGNRSADNLNIEITQSFGTPNIITNTCNGSLAKGTSCTVSGTYLTAQATPATQEVQVTLHYQTENAHTLTQVTTTQVTASPSNLVGSLVVPNYLPPLIAANTSYPIQVLFTNTTANTINLSDTGNLSCTLSTPGDCDSLLQGVTSSCNTSLPSTAACQLQATFMLPSSPTPGNNYVISASLNYSGTGSPASISTNGTYVGAIPVTRTITLSNQCNFPVWFSLNGSAVSGFSCNAQGAGCPAGTRCNTTTKACYWANPAPNNGTSYQLPATVGTNTVTIPAYNYGGTQWSGNISASLNCSGTSCAQADCQNNGGQTSCAPGIGFTQPATQAEITMNAESSDSYDVEVINGFHLPISMQPFYYTNIPATANNYQCGTPGNQTAANNFGACNWANAQLPTPVGGTGFSSGYYWVTNGGTACNINSATSQCPTVNGKKQLCGLYQNPANFAFSQVCGNFLGYWSADEVCSYSGLPTSISSFFNCHLSLPTTTPSFPANATLYNLMACQVPTGDTNPLYNSCYLSYSGFNNSQIQTCCGCVDWWNSSQTAGTNIQANPTTQSCGSQIDPVWTQYVQPMVQWMKAICPSAYVYPFDDKSSGFSCTNNLPNQPNSTNYTITFCPGNTGLPSNVAEGRG